MHMTEDAKRIIDDSIRAVLPDAAVYRALEGRRFDRPVTVIAIGKAAWRMANAAAKALGENLREGIVITKYGHSEGDIPRMTIYEAAHPIPDEAGVAATRAALALADRMTAQDEVIFLVSGGGSALFEQPLEGVTLYLDGGSVSASEIESGMSAEVWYTGGVQETYPAKFSQVVAVSLSREENAQYDLCGLYLQVLEDLWNEDDGLNGGAEVVSVDLSKAPGGLTAGEKAAVAYIYAQKHGVQGLTMTFDELREEGYLMGEKLEGGSMAYSFTNGLLFTITPEETQDNGASVCFSAGKWRSPLGAYYFTKCTASRGDSGWEYSVGAELIS